MLCKDMNKWFLLLAGVLVNTHLFAVEPGDLDPLFYDGGISGLVVGNYTDTNEQAEEMLRQSDGKLLLAGSHETESARVFVLQRLLENGAPDRDFGQEGTRFLQVGTGEHFVTHLIEQTDGKLVLTGLAAPQGQQHFMLVRLEQNGQLDSSFNGGQASGGVITTPVGSGESFAFNVIQQADGKLVAVGKSQGSGDTDFTVVRYNPDGTLDTAFGVDGIVQTNVNGDGDAAYSVIEDANQRLLVAGVSGSGGELDMTLLRYLSDGTLDTSFGNNGRVVTSVSSGVDVGFSLSQQSDGKLLLAGYSTDGGQTRLTVVRYKSGVLDSGFSSDGIATAGFASGLHVGSDLSVQPDGKLLLSGILLEDGMYDLVLTRFLVDGSTDTDFGDEDPLDENPADGIDRLGLTRISLDGNSLFGYAHTLLDSGFAVAVSALQGGGYRFSLAALPG